MGATIAVCLTHTKQDVSFPQILCLGIEMGMECELVERERERENKVKRDAVGDSCVWAWTT